MKIRRLASIKTTAEFKKYLRDNDITLPLAENTAALNTPYQLEGKTLGNRFAILPMEGRSLVPAFANQPIQRDALYWEHEGNAAVRVGDWKLVRLGRNGPWELYNLKADRTELHDLAVAEPARAADLAAKWEAWASRANVKPYPGSPAANKAGKKGKKQQSAPAS